MLGYVPLFELRTGAFFSASISAPVGSIYFLIRAYTVQDGSQGILCPCAFLCLEHRIGFFVVLEKFLQDVFNSRQTLKEVNEQR